MFSSKAAKDLQINLGAMSLVALKAISLKSVSEPRMVSAKTSWPRPKTANDRNSIGAVALTPMRTLAPTWRSGFESL